MKDLFYFLKYLKRGKVQFIFAFVCGLAYGGMSGLGIPVIFEKVFRKVFESGDETFTIGYIMMLGALLPGIFLVRGLLSFLNAYFMSYSGMIIMEGLRLDIFKRMQFLPLSFFDKNSQGDLISRMAMDPMVVQNAVLQFASEIFRQPTQMIGAFGTLIYVCIQHESYLMIPLFLVATGIAIVPIRMVKNRAKNAGQHFQGMAGGIIQQISENLDATTEVRSFNLQSSEISKHQEHLTLMKRMGLLLAKYQKMQQPIAEFFSALVVGSVFVYAYSIQMPFSAFMALGLALYFAIDPLKRLGSLMTEMHIAQGAMERIKYVLEMPLDIEDKEDAVDIGRVKGEIAFEGVHFSYVDTPTLVDINVKIPAGKKIALVGPSGAGKSTFAKLVSRFYDIQDGSIKVDGVDIRDAQVESLRANIAVVPQAPVLFNCSVKDNIKVGSLEASDEDVQKASENAYADAFIQAFPQGYDTVVGDRGDLLSGGQKQRVAIARAFLKDAPILVLDEATSSLDSESEHFVQQALKELSADKTVITIAHRLSTIRSADIIFVFNEGRIIATGTHDELIAGNDIYQSFFHKQNIESMEHIGEEVLAI